MTKEYSVEVQSDFLERQTKTLPVHAVAELVWNSIDADATAVTVDFENDKRGGMAKIVVADSRYRCRTGQQERRSGAAIKPPA